MKRLIAYLSLLLSPLAFAAEKPLWEFGVGIGSYSAPHYLGSDQSATYTVPLPFLVYRGEYIKSGHAGLIGMIYQGDRIDLRVSLGASLPVNNQDNRAREGMPDLDFVFEAGPTLQYQLYRLPGHEIRVDLPLRAALSVGHGIEYRGLIANPRLYYRFEPGEWRFATSVGPLYGSDKYHAYFYDVKEKYVTATRPEYKAGAGYTAMRYSVSLSRRLGQLFYGAFVNYYDISGAVYEDSPLVKRSGYMSTGLAVTWVFAESDDLVQVTGDEE